MNSDTGLASLQRLDIAANSRSAATPMLLAPIARLLLTESDAAELLALSARKLWELAARGAIRCIKIDGAKRYRLSDLEDWVNRGCPTTKGE